jgi:hypothetical protein
VADILDMKEKRQQLTAKRGFEGWNRRYSEHFNEYTRPVDVSDLTLGKLIQPGEESSSAFNEFIMGVQKLGAGARFDFLENLDKMEIMDITLFLIDQLRFEAMRRKGWIDDLPTSTVPLVELVAEFPVRFSHERHYTPPLSARHPRYSEYQKTFEGDRPAFIRRLIPEILEIYKKNATAE